MLYECFQSGSIRGSINRFACAADNCRVDQVHLPSNTEEARQTPNNIGCRLASVHRFGTTAVCLSCAKFQPSLDA